MARSFHEVGPDRLLIREGGGCLSIFGLPFLCAGIFMCLAALGIVPMSNTSDLPSYASALPVLMGLVFTAVGGTLVFGRAWTTVDATRREVVKEWGLLWPMHRTAHTIDGHTIVSIAFESGDSDSADQYPIVLRSGGGPRVKVCSFTDYGTSRACAATVARHLRLDLEDATTDHARRIPASQADFSLKQRARLEQEREEPAEPPVSARTMVSYESDRIRIAIPNPRPRPVVMAFMLLPLAIPLVVVGPLSRFFRQTNAPNPIEWIFLGLLIVGFGILPATSALSVWLRSRFGATIVTVSSEGLVLENRGVWRTKAGEAIASGDIVDLDFSTRESTIESARLAAEQRMRESDRSLSASPTIGPRTERMIAMLSRFTKGRGVTVKTRQGLTRFGEGLADDEIRYLHGIVRRALVR
jgi:hypothetical protein